MTVLGQDGCWEGGQQVVLGSRQVGVGDQALDSSGADGRYLCVSLNSGRGGPLSVCM